MVSVRMPHIHPAAPVRAAQYIRMSTDHQEYSPVFQREAISRYAGVDPVTQDTWTPLG